MLSMPEAEAVAEGGSREAEGGRGQSMQQQRAVQRFQGLWAVLEAQGKTPPKPPQLTGPLCQV